MEPAARDVRDLCRRALAGDLLGEPDLARLLAAHGEAAEAVFAAARAARARSFGDAVFLYGFVYFSTFCRNECTFCFYRAGNGESPRYRKSLDEVVAICRDLAGSGVVLLDLTMGEDPAIHDDPEYAALLELVAAVREASSESRPSACSMVPGKPSSRKPLLVSASLSFSTPSTSQSGTRQPVDR